MSRPLNADEAARMFHAMDEAREQREERSGAALGYPAGWPSCTCGLPVLDGHLTCGKVECDESGAREVSR